VSPGALRPIVAAVLCHPRLWGTALHQARLLTPRGWWRRAPFLPVPAADYVRFRLVTQYGSADAPVSATDVLNYVAWCHAQRAAR
jgi:hypothetical protein